MQLWQVSEIFMNSIIEYSPKRPVYGTHQAVFVNPALKKQRLITKGKKKEYRNPIHLARELRDSLEQGEYTSQAELARHYGITPSRVNQILKILDLCPEVITELAKLGDPLSSPLVTEHSLRHLANSSSNKQRRWLHRFKTEIHKQVI